MKLKNALLAIPLSLSFILAPATALGQQHDVQPQKATSTLKSDTNKLMKSKALNPKEEQKKLESMGIKGVPVASGKELKVKFDDGSSITYTASVMPTAPVRLPQGETQYGTLSSYYKTYSVGKQYNYGVATATTRLYTDVRHSGRYVYVRSNHPGFKGTYARNDYQRTRTIDSVGYNSDYATTELTGQFTTTAPYAGDYYTRVYQYRMDIDPAGVAYLRNRY